MNPCIAIIDRNTLCRTALHKMLEDIFDIAEVLSFDSIEEFHSDCNRYFVHFFISSDILLQNIAEFETLKKETIVLNVGHHTALETAGFKVLNLSRNEHEIAASIIRLHEGEEGFHSPATDLALSEREKEVLKMVVTGHINKEIADRLCISLPTVVYHRNNIYEKLGSNSVGRLTIYAVLSGIIDINEI